jgi:hypothetical protein
MFLTGKKYIQLSEIDQATVSSPGTPLKVQRPFFDQMSLTSTRLAIAMARATLSIDVHNQDLVFETVANFLRLQPIINAASHNLKLNPIQTKSLRDFSLTSRIGELGQGLAYIFAQEKLKYPYVADFRGYLAKHGKPLPIRRQSTPDFVLSNQSSHNLALLESKSGFGTNQAEKAEIKKGLSQCESGKAIIQRELKPFVVTKTFCASSNLVHALSPEESVLNYVDPSYEVANNDFTLDLVRFHYASWFSLVGDLSNMVRLYENAYLVQDVKYESRTFNNETFLLQPQSRFSFFLGRGPLWTLGLRRFPFVTPVRVGISEYVWTQLSQEDSKMETRIFEPVSNEEAELFTDGTIVFYKNAF